MVALLLVVGMIYSEIRDPKCGVPGVCRGFIFAGGCWACGTGCVGFRGAPCWLDPAMAVIRLVCDTGVGGAAVGFWDPVAIPAKMLMYQNALHTMYMLSYIE